MKRCKLGTLGRRRGHALSELIDEDYPGTALLKSPNLKQKATIIFSTPPPDSKLICKIITENIYNMPLTFQLYSFYNQFSNLIKVKRYLTLAINLIKIN